MLKQMKKRRQMKQAKKAALWLLDKWGVTEPHDPDNSQSGLFEVPRFPEYYTVYVVGQRVKLRLHCYRKGDLFIPESTLCIFVDDKIVAEAYVVDERIVSEKPKTWERFHYGSWVGELLDEYEHERGAAQSKARRAMLAKFADIEE